MLDVIRTEFQKLTDARETVDQAVAFLDEWLVNAGASELVAEQHAAISAHVDAQRFDLLLDAFYQRIPFGTGGRRGRVGYGPNRINHATVAAAVQGHCHYVLEQCPDAPRTMVVAYDVRIFVDIAGTYDFLPEQHSVCGLSSRQLAEVACEIYAANGFEVISPCATKDARYVTTPELSFLIREIGAAGGINVSASHNHPDDSGFKFYNQHGAQDVPPHDEELAGYMGEDTAPVKRTALATAISAGQVRPVSEALHAGYLDAALAARDTEWQSDIPVVYTPLCGTGDSSLGEALVAAGYDMRIYEPQAAHDGTFEAVPGRLPNPEVPAATRPALAFADEVGSPIVLSTDPDADRIGVFARDATDTWQFITGNEIAAVLAYYLIADPAGPRRRGLVMKTLVTTQTLAAIAGANDCDIVPDLLVGFKYMAEQLRNLAADPEQSIESFILAAEESHGVLLSTQIHDKDAAGGGVLLAECITKLVAAGRTLPAYIDEVYLQCGNYANVGRSIVMRGIHGTELQARMMAQLRATPPAAFGPRAVTACVDYLSEDVLGPIKSNTDRMSRNLLLFRLGDGGDQVVIRPSGTEPKIKVYVEIGCPGQTRKIAGDAAAALASDVYDVCIETIGLTLSDSARALPDFVELSCKETFDTVFRPALTSYAETPDTDDDAVREWLRTALSSYVAGADPLVALAPAIMHLCGAIDADDETTRAGLERIAAIAGE